VFRYTYNALVYGEEPLKDKIARVARCGYDGIELVGEPDQYDERELRSLLAENGIVASSIISIFDPSRDIVSDDPAIRRAAVDYVTANIEFGSRIGADVVTFTPTACMKISGRADRATEWTWAVEAARTLAARAADHGMCLAVEPWNRYETYLINRLDQAVDFVTEVDSPAAGVMADTFHMAIEERDIAEAIRDAGNRLTHVHLADSNRAAPGYGHTDFTPIIAAIKDVGYQGWISYELLPAAGDVWGVLQGAGAPEFKDEYTAAAIRHTKAIESLLEKHA